MSAHDTDAPRTPLNAAKLHARAACDATRRVLEALAEAPDPDPVIVECARAARDRAVRLLNTLVLKTECGGAVMIYDTGRRARVLVASPPGGVCKHEWSMDEQGTRRCIGCGEPRA